MPVPVALIGCGDVAWRHYLPSLTQASGRVDVVAVCARSRSRADATAAEFGIPAAYASADELLASTEALAVVNLTPVQLHDEINTAVLESGRHLYSEKPVASNARAARALAELASARGLIVATAPCSMLWPQVRQAIELLELIAPVASARGRGFGGVPPWPGYASDPTPFFEAGAGPHRDLGVYPLHALLGLLGPVGYVLAQSTRSQESFLVAEGPLAGSRIPVVEDDTWLLALEHDSGTLSTVEANFSAHDSRAPELELMGRNGTIALSLLDPTRPLELLRGDGTGWEQIPITHARSDGPDLAIGVEHLVECIVEGTPPILDLRSAIEVLDVLDAAVASARTGCRVEIGSFP